MSLYKISQNAVRTHIGRILRDPAYTFTDLQIYMHTRGIYPLSDIEPKMASYVDFCPKHEYCPISKQHTTLVKALALKYNVDLKYTPYQTAELSIINYTPGFDAYLLLDPFHKTTYKKRCNKALDDMWLELVAKLY
jgi:hypothetical protein